MPEGSGKPEGQGLDSAGVGVGAGTFWVVIATNLPVNFPYRSWAILLAPWVSVGFAQIWAWVKRALRRYLRRRELNTLILRVEANLRSNLNDPQVSAEHKQEAAAQLAILQRRRTEADLERIEALLTDE